MALANDDRLRLLIERVERLEEEKRGYAEDIRDVYAEAKAVGYDPKIMRQIIRLRAMAPDDRREMEAVLDTYKAALGMDSGPLFREHSDPPAKPPADPPAEKPAEPAAGTGAAAIRAMQVAAQSPTDDDAEACYRTAVALVVGQGKPSTSWLQRQMTVGYNSARGMIERMECDGILGPLDAANRREVLATSVAAAEAMIGGRETAR